MATNEKGKSGCLHNLFVGFGCGCVYPLTFLVLMTVVAWYFLTAPVQQMILAPEIPVITGPEQEHFWSFQEKRLDSKEDKASTLELTTGELNAFLSELQFAPSHGIYINRIRFYAGEKKGILFLFCSGMFLRNLVFQIELLPQESDNRIAVGEILINSYRAAKGSFIYSQTEDILKKVCTANRPDLIEKLPRISEIFSFSKDRAVIPTELIR